MTTKTRRHLDSGARATWPYWTLTLAILIGVSVFVATKGTQAADVVVYKSPTCGCCGKWVEYMKEAGFTVDVENRRDLNPIKAEYGVPRKLQSCHTAKVGGYLVEGHVPADVIRRMLKEKPDIKGLAVPGMPMGSPGMEGPHKDNYNVLAIGRDGSTEVYERR